MKLGADDPETYEDMLTRAIADLEEPKPPRPLLFQIVGWPLVIIGFAIAGFGLLIFRLGSKLAGLNS